MNKQIGTLQPVGNDQSIPAKLDIARWALTEATEDWQRIEIRDYAKAVQAATDILGRKDIQIQAANLVQDAERAIAKANPVKSREKSGAMKGKKVVTPSNDLSPISQTNLRQIRRAHAHLSDEEYEAAKAEAIQTQTPLTRAALKDKSKQKQRQETRQQREATQLSTGEQKYSIIYADPPWKYDFAETANREIENQYPTMEIEKIKSINVSEFRHTDAVLYLWATAPKLLESLSVMEAWSFAYKTNMVWVKDKIGMGYWARSQHELLLIGTRRVPLAS